MEVPTGAMMTHLLQAMAQDETADIDGFCHLFGEMLDWWKRGERLYVACCEETPAMLNNHVSTSMFLRGGGHPWILPAFVAADGPGEKIQVLWVHSSLRRRGIGSAMVKLCGFTLPDPSHVMPGARPFWRACGLRSTR